MAPRPDLAWQRIALEGRWRGGVTAPQADAQLRVEGLQLPGASGLAMLTARLSAARGDLSVHAVAEGLMLPGSHPRLLADAPLNVDATMRLSDGSRPLRLTAEHRMFSLQAARLAATTLSATVTLRLPDLGSLAALANQ